jgi:protein-tyrosine phosphatase
MIDLHSHVLPGLDDGAPDEATALAMCRMAVEDGIRTLVATPHFDAALGVCDPEVIARAADLLRQRLAQEGIDLDLRFAAEMPLTENALELYRSGGWPAYDAGRNYVLLEVPSLRNGFSILREMVFQLRMAGATPVLAHPERLEMLDDLRAAEQIRMQGAVFQLTAGCLTAPPTPARKRAVEWLRRGWVHLVASDAHNVSRRPPRLSAARQWLVEQYGDAVADALTRGNPEKILKGAAL